MIGSLRGTLLDRAVTGEVLVEVNGVGYRVHAGPVTAAQLGDLDQEVFVWTHHHVREDAHTLYGFASRDERDCFEALLAAHGVGPSLALAILSVHEPAALRRVLLDDDVAALCLVPGVGKKTAARLLIELKSRLDAHGQPTAGVSPAGAGHPPSSPRADVRDALTVLGYGAEEIADAVQSLPDESHNGDGEEDRAPDVAALVKQALRHLGARR